MFKPGNFYSRTDISDWLGRSKQSYLPHVDGKVVCGSLAAVANPDAPDAGLVEKGRHVKRWELRAFLFPRPAVTLT